MKQHNLPYGLIDYPDLISPPPTTVSMSINKNRQLGGGYSIQYPNSFTMKILNNKEEFIVGDFVRLINLKIDQYIDNYKYIFIIKGINKNIISITIKLLNITLKEQTGFDYCIYVNSYSIEKDLKTTRLYKLKQIIKNGKEKTNIQKQREQTFQSRGNRLLALPFSCG